MPLLLIPVPQVKAGSDLDCLELGYGLGVLGFTSCCQIVDELAAGITCLNEDALGIIYPSYFESESAYVYKELWWDDSGLNISLVNGFKRAAITFRMLALFNA